VLYQLSYIGFKPAVSHQPPALTNTPHPNSLLIRSGVVLFFYSGPPERNSR
jgi:hypothetical protein